MPAESQLGEPSQQFLPTHRHTFQGRTDYMLLLVDFSLNLTLISVTGRRVGLRRKKAVFSWRKIGNFLAAS